MWPTEYPSFLAKSLMVSRLISVCCISCNIDYLIVARLSTVFFNFLLFSFILCNALSSMGLMAKRLKALKEFGLTLRGYRDSLNKSQEQVGRELHSIAGGKKSDKTTIHRDEAGKSASIPQDRLRGYSILYKQNYENLVSGWVKARYGVDFSGVIEVVQCLHDGKRELYGRIESIVDNGLEKILLSHLSYVEGEYPASKKEEAKS